MLRAGEYVQHPGKPWDYNKVICGVDVEFRVKGRVCKDDEEPDEMTLRIRGSKVDQLNVGQVRNHYATDEELCVVKAMWQMRKKLPHRFGKGSEALLPLFRWSTGEPITRTEIVSWLTKAALSQGVPPERVASHSLRIGGATALYHTCGDLGLVQRMGRWKSGCFHIYLWEAS